MATDGGSDFLVIANRLPVDRIGDKWVASPGGLVTALKPVLQHNNGAWIGWPGTTKKVKAKEMPPRKKTGIDLIPVNLSEADYEEFYEGFSNAGLWPLYHDLIVHPRYKRSWWASYHAVNRRFADKAIKEATPGATVWVQDYQLHLVPGMIREARPDLRIGFFLHIPFPAPELFRQLPWRREVLAGTLGADLIGFQTQDSARNFLHTLRALDFDVHYDDPTDAEFVNGARLPEENSVIGWSTSNPPPTRAAAADAQAEVDGKAQQAREHVTRIGVFPISLDSAAVELQAQQPETLAKAQHLSQQLGSPKVLMAGVDRLDYTKGIVQRLLALEELLDSGELKKHGLKAKDISMVQVATPSRERLEDYQATRKDVERIVSRINGKHGSMGRPVVSYVHSHQSFKKLVALYLAADIMLVTALKDGMNLVAKEYVACHSDGTGALVLSEFTGAATQLTSAFMCNPYDKTQLSQIILAAATSKPSDRRARMRKMWENVREFDVDHWADSFLAELRTDATSPGKEER